MKTIGILGGMGPEATVHFLGLLVKHTRAARDQDHLPAVVWSCPQIPPRTAAVLEGGASPLPWLLRGAKLLRRAGADFLVMPCMTAHFYYPELKKKAGIPVINLVEETLIYARRRFPSLKTVGIIATTGTVQSGVFGRSLAAAGVGVLAPDARGQARIMEAIYGRRGIKAGFAGGRSRRLVLAEARRLVRLGAQAVVAGCTEIPLVLKDKDLPVPLLEPMRIGALACIQKAGGRVRNS